MPRAEQCTKCGQNVIRRGHFWVLESEVESQRVTMCPQDGLHDVEACPECFEHDGRSEFDGFCSEGCRGNAGERQYERRYGGSL